MSPVAQADLRRVARAAEKVAAARRDLKQAIRIAKASGESNADIGAACQLTRQRIDQILREKESRG